MKTIALLILLSLAGVAIAQPFDAGVSDAGSAVSALPSAVDTSPIDQASFAWKLYKGGHLVPALIVAAFFVLFLLERRIAWLRTGYRKVAVASLLGGLGMLAERVASGSTPNTMMVMGAVGAAFTMWMKTQGPPPEPEKA